MRPQREARSPFPALVLPRLACASPIRVTPLFDDEHAVSRETPAVPLVGFGSCAL